MVLTSAHSGRVVVTHEKRTRGLVNLPIIPWNRLVLIRNGHRPLMRRSYRLQQRPVKLTIVRNRLHACSQLRTRSLDSILLRPRSAAEPCQFGFQGTKFGRALSDRSRFVRHLSTSPELTG